MILIYYVETLSSFMYKYKWPVGPMRPGSEVIKLFQLRMKCTMLISMINTTSEGLKARKVNIFSILVSMRD